MKKEKKKPYYLLVALLDDEPHYYTGNFGNKGNPVITTNKEKALRIASKGEASKTAVVVNSKIYNFKVEKQID